VSVAKAEHTATPWCDGLHEGPCYRPDVSRESTAGGDLSGDIGDALTRLRRLEDKVDELLTDSRAARPLLERYLRIGGGRMPWAGAGKAGRRT
jgi:hypothetical protein